VFGKYNDILSLSEEFGEMNSKEQVAINTIRALSMDAIQAANSGHPGAPMGLASAGFVLFTKILKHSPKDPKWFNRDRFILSGGHASMLLYSLLHLSGYDLSMEDIKNFRQWGSKTPGHPEYGHTPGVETTTGPLGQGFATAVGMAMAERHLAARFNCPDFSIVDHYTYVFCGDGDLMEGISHEAGSLAGHLGLGRLICLYDSNRISIEGSTDLTFTEDVQKRFEAYGWDVYEIDGNDTDHLEKAFLDAKAKTDKPTLIIARTQIAYGSPNKQGSASAHGAPLGEEEILLTKKALGISTEMFFVPEEVYQLFKIEVAEKGAEAQKEWEALVKTYADKEPTLWQAFKNAIEGVLPADWAEEMPSFTESIATRSASGKVLNMLAKKIPELMGGSADLAPSNNSAIEKETGFQKGNYIGRNIHFGVRELGMGAIASGLTLHGGILPYCATFLAFADYMKPSIRLAALMGIQVVYIFTHDSIAVGEDGPTHQPVEQLAMLRAIPNLIVIRPADAKETVSAWKQAILHKNGPVALILSRQNLPILNLDQTEIDAGVAQGAYVVSENENAEVILIATGSEVSVCLGAQKILAEKGINARIVSMPSWELFEATSPKAQEKILPKSSPRISVEAGLPVGWERYTSEPGASIAMTHFGACGPGNRVMAEMGFTEAAIASKALTLLRKKRKQG